MGWNGGLPRPSPVSPVMPRVHQPSSTQPLTSHSRLDCMASQLVYLYPLYNLLPICLSGSFPTPPPPKLSLALSTTPPTKGVGYPPNLRRSNLAPAGES